MGYPLRPKFSVTIGMTTTNLTLTWPQFPWDVGLLLVGGGERTSVPSNYLIRSEPVMDLRIRVVEGTEQGNLLAFLLLVMDGRSFTFWPDVDVTGTSYTVYLESPSVANGDKIMPSGRDTEPSVLIYNMTVRRSTSTVISQAYYG